MITRWIARTLKLSTREQMDDVYWKLRRIQSSCERTETRMRAMDNRLRILETQLEALLPRKSF